MYLDISFHISFPVQLLDGLSSYSRRSEAEWGKRAVHRRLAAVIGPKVDRPLHHVYGPFFIVGGGAEWIRAERRNGSEGRRTISTITLWRNVTNAHAKMVYGTRWNYEGNKKGASRKLSKMAPIAPSGNRGCFQTEG